MFKHLTMKNTLRLLFFLCLFGVLSPGTKGQMYERAFDRWDAALNNGQGYANLDNLQAALAWDESRIMESYMIMFRTTGDRDYLDRLLEHSALVLNQRDDNAGRTNYLGTQSPTWVCNIYSANGANYPWLVHSGMITYPMADFVQEVFNNPALQNLNVQANNPTWAGLSYMDVAWDLLNEVLATTNWHSTLLTNTAEYNAFAFSTNGQNWWLPQPTTLNCVAYNFPGGSAPGEVLGDLEGDIVPLNHQNAMGRTLLSLWRATGDQATLNIVTGIANSTKRVLWNQGFQSNVFSYWGYKGTDGEDVAHAAITFDFARMCFEEGIVFDQDDMIRFASTLKNHVYMNPHQIEGYIDGHSDGWYPVNSGLPAFGAFGYFAQWDRDLYHIIGEEYNEEALYNANSNTAILWTYLSNMARYNELFTPALYYGGYGNGSDWVDVDAGDIDGDGSEEIVSARNFDGRIYVHGFSENSGHDSYNLHGEGVFQPNGFTPEWGGVAVGNFNDLTPQDEIAVVSNLTGQLYLFTEVNGQYYQYAQTSGLSANSQWAGLAAADLDHDGNDEIIGVRNLDGDIYVWNNFSNTLGAISIYSNAGPASDWADISAGDFDGDNEDEIVLVRNFDGNVYIMEFETGTTNLVEIAQYTAAGSNSNWTSITGGNFDLDDADEFILHRNYDGDFYISELDANNDIVQIGRENFPIDQNLGVLGTVNIGTACCEELVSMRNYDGDIYVYSVGLGGCDLNVTCRKGQEGGEGEGSPEGKTAFATDHDMDLFPNPAANQARLEWELDVPTEVQIDLYDLQGRKVQQIEAGRLAAGAHSLRIDRNGLPAGMYVLKITLGTETQVKKLVWE